MSDKAQQGQAGQPIEKRQPESVERAMVPVNLIRPVAETKVIQSEGEKKGIVPPPLVHVPTSPETTSAPVPPTSEPRKPALVPPPVVPPSPPRQRKPRRGK